MPATRAPGIGPTPVWIVRSQRFGPNARPPGGSSGLRIPGSRRPRRPPGPASHAPLPTRGLGSHKNHYVKFTNSMSINNLAPPAGPRTPGAGLRIYTEVIPVTGFYPRAWGVIPTAPHLFCWGYGRKTLARALQ